MKTHKRVRRLHEVRPLEVAKTIERALQQDRKKIDRWLSATDTLDDDGVPLTLLGETVVSLTAYAHGDAKVGEKEARALARHARDLVADIASNFIMPIDPNGEEIENIDPYLSELTVICCAALGRYRIEVEEAPVPDAWLAAMLSVKVSTLRTYLCLPHKPGVHIRRAKRGTITHASAKALLERREML